MKTTTFRKQYARVSLLILIIFVTVSASLLATTTCTNQGCVSEVNFAEFAQDAYQPQYQTEWCWAASISMVFAYYGHPVSQPRIVSEVYGAPVNMTSGYGINVARLLNREWRDDNGNRFRATLTGAYDFDAHVNNLTNAALVKELDQDRPIIVGAGGHAMVLTHIGFYPTNPQPTIAEMGVFDPWPGRGARSLTLPEMNIVERGGTLRFVATVRVQDLGN
jgi:hypothetical protein